MLKQAHLEKTNMLDLKNRNMRGEIAPFLGRLGEIVAEQWFSDNEIAAYRSSESENKLGIDYKIANFDIDVKSKHRNINPKINYDETVFCYQHELCQCDYYLFVDLVGEEKNPSSAWVVGFLPYKTMSKNEIWRKGKYRDLDNGKKIKNNLDDCYVTNIGSLGKPNEFVDNFRVISWYENQCSR